MFGWLVGLAVLSSALNIRAADFRDSFEAPHTGWRIAEADCPVQIQIHERSFREAHTGSGSEHVRVKNGLGSYVHLSYTIDRAPVIAEFTPRLWVKASRPGVKLLARVVLPRTSHPQTGKPLTVLLRGDEYTDAGAWQNLALNDTAKLLQREVVVLRTQFGKELDPREAFVDLIVVNAYTGEGTLEFWLDDLELPGYVPAQDRGGGATSVDLTPAQAPPPSIAVLKGSLLMVDAKPIFPRIIDAQLASLDQARDLGFHAVKLAVSPSPEWLREAQRTKVWLVAPPPQQFSGNAKDYSSILAWSLGVHLSDKEHDVTKQVAENVRRNDPQQHRPTLIGVDADLANYSRLGGVVLLDRPCPGTSMELAELNAEFQGRTEFLRPGTPYWATVNVPPLGPVAQQVSHLVPELTPVWDVDPESLKQQAYAALQVGARGLVFRSALPLDESPAGTLRAEALKLLNFELAPLEPWVSAHAQVYSLDTGDPLVQAALLQTNRSRLVLLSRHAPANQFAAGPPNRPQFTLTIPGVPLADRAYLITPAGLKQLRTTHSSGGLRITLEDLGLTAAIVVTQDSLAMHHLTRILNETAQSSVRLKWELTRRRVDLIEDVHRILTQQGHPLAAATVQIREARGNLTQAEALLKKGDPSGPLPFLLRTEQALAKVRRGYWEQTAAAFPSLAASPCCADVSALPLHWQLAEKMQQSRWSASNLVAGEMDDLSTLVNNGWKQQRHVPEGVAAEVAITTNGPHGGQGALQLIAKKLGMDPPELIERPLVWITTPAVQVTAGQIVRIHGWVNVPKPLSGSREGLLIFDSLAGPDLGDRVKRTQGWREFTLYRAAPAAGELRVTFALTGIGEALVDDVSIHLLELQPLSAGQ